MLDLLSLKLFVECVNVGSLTRVAKEQHIALAALSRRMTLLEEHYGVSLLQRTGRGVKATDAGYTLLKKAHDIFQQVNLTQADLGDFHFGKKGSVSIIASTSAITYHLPLQLSHFNAENPDIRVEIDEGFTEEILDALRNHRHELGIIIQTALIEDLVSVPYDSDELVLVTANKAQFSSTKIHFEEFSSCDFVLMDGSTAISKLVLSAANKLGKIIRIRVRVSSFESVCRMVEAGFGVGVIPKKIATQFSQTMNIDYVEIDEPWSTRELLLCYSNSRKLSLAAEKLLQFLSQQSSEY